MIHILRKTRNALWSGLVLTVLVGLLGCNKQPFMATVEQTPYLGLPANVESLNCIDLGRLRTRDNFLTVMNGLETSLQAKPLLDVLRQKVGFDPWKDMDLLIMSERGAVDPANPLKNSIFIAMGQFKDPAPKLELLRQWLSEDYLVDPPAFQKSLHPGTSFQKFQTHGQSQFNVRQVYELNFAFPSDRLMLFSFSSTLLNETLDVFSGQTPGLQKDKAWQQMLDRPDIGAPIWGTGNIKPNAGGSLSPIPLASILQSGKQYYYSVNISDDVKAEVGIVCVTIDSATQLTQTIKGLVDQVKAVVALKMATVAPETAKLADKLQLTTEQETSKLFLNLTSDQRKALMDEWEDLGEKAAKLNKTVPGKAPKPGLPLAAAQPAVPAPVAAPGKVQ